MEILIGIAITWVITLIIAHFLPDGDCPDCGIFACKNCSEKYAAIDEELERRGL